MAVVSLRFFFFLLLSLYFHFVEHLHSNVTVDQNSVKIRGSRQGLVKRAQGHHMSPPLDPPRSSEIQGVPETRECHDRLGSVDFFVDVMFSIAILTLPEGNMKFSTMRCRSWNVMKRNMWNRGNLMFTSTLDQRKNRHRTKWNGNVSRT